MSIVTKLWLFILLNLAGFISVLAVLRRRGIRGLTALRLMWTLLYGEKGEIVHETHSLPRWVAFLGVTWRLLPPLSALVWFFRPEAEAGMQFLLVVFIHLGWLCVIRTEGKPPERVLTVGSGWGVIKHKLDAHSGLNGKSLAELDLRRKNLLVLAIERQADFINFPRGLEILAAGDKIILFGDLRAYELILKKI